MGTCAPSQSCILAYNVWVTVKQSVVVPPVLFVFSKNICDGKPVRDHIVVAALATPTAVRFLFMPTVELHWQ